jgi:hypothetical protein
MGSAASCLAREWGDYGYRFTGVESPTPVVSVFTVRCSDGAEFAILADKWGNCAVAPDGRCGACGHGPSDACCGGGAVREYLFTYRDFCGAPRRGTEPYEVVVCAHCSQVIEQDGSAWRHRDSGWAMCDVSARTFAEPRAVAEPAAA